ncbi:gastrula zinc finger protein XlCGF57.1-like [Topomyia yanbarensis]|uniref:gastrula zinc finger protein XlCGF57.1-like n=1 Tax=Topomyia yanbarensis TaxID=2498891 RepID=UPI00273C991E|nr:gastrula zinc finger protein XlCGF57.1-like [Topomyia yanbarensis]
MKTKATDSVCRVCLEPKNTLNMWPIVEALIDQRTSVDIIEDCFGVVISENSMNLICMSCKYDLEGAYRFVTSLRESESRLNSSVTKIEEQGYANDYDVPSIYITEVEIKTEILEATADQNDNQDELIDYANLKYSETNGTVEKTEPTMRRKKGRPKKRRKEDLQSNTAGHKTKVESYDWATEHSYIFDSSDDDSICSDYEQSMTSDEDSGANKPRRKRFYYGVKSNSLPKRCCCCKEPLDSQEKVQEHAEMYHQSSRITNPKEYGDKLFECPVCFKRFETKMLFLQHQRKMYVDVLHPCPLCEEEFANLFVLKKHLKIDHQKKFKITVLEEMRTKSNICCGCKEKFTTQSALKEHVDKIHYPERVLCETTNTFECNVCYNRFKTYKSLKHHQLRLFKEKKFVCTLCGKKFREKVRLAEHENLHRKIRKFECTFCPAKFAIKNSYDVHVKMHDAEESFNCEYCGKGFRKKSLLLSHLQIHSTTRPFKCHVCPNTFNRQNLLDSHLLGHSGSKPHKCKQCSASYIHQRDLRRHIREKHEGIRSFKCSICPKAYIRQKLLVEHLKTHDE